MRGIKILVDRKHRATVWEHFPEGSTSFGFAHYVVRYVPDGERVAVASWRVLRADDSGVALDLDGFPVRRAV